MGMRNLNRIFAALIVFISTGFVMSLPSCRNEPTHMPSPGEKVIVKQSGGAAALIKECTRKSFVTDKADYIVEGPVEKVESQWNETRTRIYTYTDLKIDNYVKGTPFASNELQIVTPGGTVGEITEWAEDQPIFHEGKKVRIYFEWYNGEWRIVCATLGVEEISMN
jgi:hypothetical protein